jgi:hypothetical protein
MALDLLHPEDRGRFKPDTLERFYDGDDYEESCRARLLKAGRLADPSFKLLGAQERFEIRDRSGRVVIVGKLDEQVQFETDPTRYPVEIKSGVSVQRVDTFDDFAYSPWTRPMPYQLLAYLLAMGSPMGLFILNRPGLPNFVPVDLEDNLDMAESFLSKATRAVDCLEGDDLPPFTADKSECRRCDHYGKTCTPDIDYGPGVQIIDDEVLLEAARVRHETAEAAAKHRRAHDQLKKALRGCEHGLIGGEFEVTGRWQRSTKYDVPKLIKDRYKVVDEQGRFVLDFQLIED